MRKYSMFILALVMAFTVPLQVSAVDPYEKIPYVEGETSLGLQVVDSLPESLSFEVPLYVTTAAIDMESEVLAPKNYYIKNTSVNHMSEGVDIAVIKVTTTAHDTKNYWNFVQGAVEEVNDMAFTIGNMPIVVDDTQEVELDLTDSVFYNKGTGKFTKIAYNEMIIIPIAANVKATLRSELENTSAVAQFSIKYTVSLLDENDDPVGVYYEGPTID